MTDLSQQPQYFVQPQPDVVQPPMVYSAQQATSSYPPQPQVITYPAPGIPQQQVPYNWNAYETPTYASAPPHFVDTGHVDVRDDVPMKTLSAEQGFVEESEEQQHHSYHSSHSLPAVITCSDVLNWIAEGWHMYIENWIPYTLLSFVFVVIITGNIVFGAERMSYLGSLSFLSFPLSYGWFIAGSQVLKEKERLLRQGGTADPLMKVQPRLGDFFRGYFVFFPLWGYNIVIPFFIGLGLILFIVPGLYLMVTLSFVPYIYIEYHRQQSFTEVGPDSPMALGFCDCIGHCRRVIHQHFWEVAFFLIVQFGILLLGGATVIGALVVIPVVQLSYIPAFRALFQFQMDRVPDDKCYCCC